VSKNKIQDIIDEEVHDVLMKLKELDVRKTHGDKRIENPATGNDIKLRTALKAKKGSAAYSKGRAIYNALKAKGQLPAGAVMKGGTPGGPESAETGPSPTGDGAAETGPDTAADPGQEAGVDSDNDGIPDVIDVPAFDMKIMDNILGVPLVKHTVQNFAKLGAALGKEEDQEVIKAFKSVLLPALASFQKKAHIDIAEHMSMDEMLLEANEPLSKRQMAYKKGRSRKGLGIKAYLKSMGGKDPKFTRMLVASLEKSLIDGADKKFSAAFQKALSGVKDKKVQKEQAKFFQKNPEKRLEAYKHNATEIINQVKKISNLAAKKAMAKHKKKPQRALPEQ